jgi:hypothetical protein
LNVRLAIILVLSFACSCTRSSDDADGSTDDDAAAREACEARYAKLEELGCEAKLEDLLARGCFEPHYAPDDCDQSVLDPCIHELGAFAEQPEPLGAFLDRKCGPEGTRTIEWPKQPDTATLAAAKRAAREQQAAIDARKVEEDLAAAEKLIKTTKVEIGEPVIHGPLSERAVVQTIEGKLDDVRRCYALGLARTPGLAGEVAAQFVVNQLGKVAASVVHSTTVRDSQVGNCIAKGIKRMQFPSAKRKDGSGTTIVTLPFTLGQKE